MASKHSYQITLSNNITEKEALRLVLEHEPDTYIPDSLGRKQVLELLELEPRFRRAFDLIKVENLQRKNNQIILDDPSKITLIEIKSTKKKLEHNPYGFFFGATQNEFELAALLGDRYQFCFVCLHPETTGIAYQTLEEIEAITKNKRVQYQINLDTYKSKET